jgi:NAD(P)-dependent dehydrogenase (short-subunit alcohol dehydrogenase family)
VHGSGDQAVDLAQPEHHHADRHRVGQVLAGHVLGPALVPAQLGQRGDVTLGDGLRIQHRDALGQPQAEPPGPFCMSQAVLPHFIERGSGRIVMISSYVGQVGRFGQANYAAAKSGQFA